MLHTRRKFDRRSGAPFGPREREPGGLHGGGGEVLSEDLPESRGHGDGPNTGLGLGLAEEHRTTDLDELAVDAEGSAEQVNLVQGESGKLPPPEAHVTGRENERPVERRMHSRERRELPRLEEAHPAGVLRR